MNRPAILYALASAALFGVTTPAAKILLGAIDPIVLAGCFIAAPELAWRFFAALPEVLCRNRTLLKSH
jgi:hypothetical protein